MPNISDYIFSKRFFVTLLMVLAGAPAYSYTECPPAQVVRVWVDNAANAEIGFSSSLVLIAGGSQAGTKSLVAVATAAMLSGKNVIFRISADGASCTGGNHSDWWGIHMVNY